MVPPHHHQHFMLSLLFNFSHFHRYAVIYVIVLIIYSLMANDIEHLSFHVIIHWLFSLVNCLYMYFVHMFFGQFFSSLLNFERYLHILNTNFFRHTFCKYFPQVVACFYPPHNVFQSMKVPNFDKVKFITFLIMYHAFVVKSKDSLPSALSQRFSHNHFSKIFIILHFICKSVIHFKLMFI